MAHFCEKQVRVESSCLVYGLFLMAQERATSARSTPPSFYPRIIAFVSHARENVGIVEGVWSRVLGLGFGLHRAFLKYV